MLKLHRRSKEEMESTFTNSELLQYVAVEFSGLLYCDSNATCQENIIYPFHPLKDQNHQNPPRKLRPRPVTPSPTLSTTVPASWPKMPD